MNNRRKCEQSQIIITNHAQLLQDIKLDGSILPDYRHLIVDEAHHLEDEAIKQFTDTVDLELLRKSAKQLERPGSVINRILRKLHDIPIFTEIYTHINDAYTEMHDDIAQLDKKPRKAHYRQRAQKRLVAGSHRAAKRLPKFNPYSLAPSELDSQFSGYYRCRRGSFKGIKFFYRHV